MHVKKIDERVSSVFTIGYIITKTSTYPLRMEDRRKKYDREKREKETRTKAGARTKWKKEKHQESVQEILLLLSP